MKDEKGRNQVEDVPIEVLMNGFRVSSYFQNLPQQQWFMARFELASWLSVRGEASLAKAVCNATTPEGLAPHLAYADKLTSEGVEAATIFRQSRLFVRRGAIDEAPTVGPSLAELREKLKSIHEEMSVRNPPGSKTEGAYLADEIGIFLSGAPEGATYRSQLEAYILGGQGYLAGAAGSDLIGEELKALLGRIEDVSDVAEYGARLFLDAVRAQYISSFVKIHDHHAWLVDACMKGALSVWDLDVSGGKVPEFLGTVTRHWARAHATSYSKEMEDYSSLIGSGLGRFLMSRMKVGITAGLPRSPMLKTLHLWDVEMFVYGRGWMRGIVDGREGEGEWVTYLRNNCKTIGGCAIRKRDVGYMAEAVLRLPEMLDWITARERRLEEQESGDELRTIRSNRASIIYYALTSGKLLDYVKEALEAVPKLLLAVDEEVRRLNDEGEIELANAEGELEVANAREKLEVANAISANAKSIIYRCLGYGGLLRYLNEVFLDVPEMLITLNEGIKEFEEKGNLDAAKLIRSNRGSIISDALAHGGRLKAARAALKAVPEMFLAIVEGIKQFEDEGKFDAATSVRLNSGSIIYQAFYQGGLLDYVREALKAVPKMLGAMDAEVKRFEDEEEHDAAEAISANRPSIMSRALNEGGLTNYVNQALKAVPDMFRLIDEEVQRLEAKGRFDVAEPIRANRKSIINKALNQGTLMGYVEEALNAVPEIVRTIDREVTKFETEGKLNLANAIRSVRKTIISRALDNGGLVDEVRVRLAERINKEK